MKGEKRLMNFMVSEDLHQAVKEKCVRHRVSMANVMRVFLEEWVKIEEPVDAKDEKE